MFIEFKVSNFLSIKDEIVLSMDSTASKTLPNNFFSDLDYTLLKTAAIYGANASGKSNLIKALYFAHQLIRDSITFTIDTKLFCVPFLLDKTSKNKPSSFEFTFIKNETKYIYGFSCKEDGFVKEYLYYKPKGENKKLFFSRDEKLKSKREKFKFNIDSRTQKKWGKETIKQRLYLPKAVNDHNYEKLAEVYDYLVNDNIVVLQDYNENWAKYTRDRLMKDKRFKKWALTILKKADFGGIEDIRIQKEKRLVTGLEMKMEGKSPSFKPIVDREQEFYDLSFIHLSDDSKEIIFKEDLESTGTNKTLNLLGPIYNILKQGKTVFIDEFELNLHPNITEFLIKLFHSKHNRKNGQLIITTHDTTLLKNIDLFRRDQVYICTKEPNKSTQLTSLSDFDLRETINFENAYLNGRVGGLPFIDETIFED